MSYVMYDKSNGRIVSTRWSGSSPPKAPPGMGIVRLNRALNPLIEKINPDTEQVEPLPTFFYGVNATSISAGGSIEITTSIIASLKVVDSSDGSVALSGKLEAIPVVNNVKFDDVGVYDCTLSVWMHLTNTFTVTVT